MLVGGYAFGLYRFSLGRAMRVILKISGGHYRLGNSHPKFLKSTHSPTAKLRIFWIKGASFLKNARNLKKYLGGRILR